MADRKISDLTALTTPASGDYLPIVDISEAAAASKNKRVTVQSLFQGIPVNVGIGTSSPGKTLEVNGETYITGGIASQGAHIYRDGGTGGAVYSAQTGDTSVISPGAANVRLETNGLERLRIDSSGRVGIGTSSPRFNLSLGAVASTQSATPTTLDLGGSYSSTAGANPKLRVYWDGTDYYGFGVSGSQLDYMVNSPQASHVFYTNGLERLRIDSSGRVGIGTSSPGANSALEVAGNQKYLSVITNAGGGGSVNPSHAAGLHFSWNRSNGDGESNIIYGTGSGAAPNLQFASWDGTTYTERMRIGSNGITTIASAIPSAAVVAIDNSSNTSGTQSLTLQNRANANDTSSYYLVCQEPGVANRCFIYGNGNLANANNVYGAISDIKHKENIVDASSQWADFKNLQVRKYNLKEAEGFQGHTQIGLIAQEAEQVCPGLVFETPDRDTDGNNLGTVTKSINYSILYMKAVKALQEAMERIETLEAAVAALQSA